jgi:hypothetical protein
MGSNDKTEIIKEEMVSYDINNGWVYYLNLKKELYKIRVDGSGKQLLATGLPLGKIKVFRDNILVYLDKEIYKVESDGKCKVISGKFESDISEFTYGFIYAVTDHWVLYRDFNKKSYKYTLYRVKIDGTSKEERLSDYTG